MMTAATRESSDSPMFSVVIPTHNRAHLLGRAISSVLDQSLGSLELIVVDDGSTDETSVVVESIADSRIRYVRQSKAGAAAARNHGARLAQGGYLTFLDSDDEAERMWLESLHDGFVSSGADIVCCGLVKTGVGPEVDKKGGVHLPDDMGPIFDHIRGRFTNGGVFAMRRGVFEAVGGYAEELRSGQHTELAMRLLPLARELGWQIHNVMQPLIRVHVHDGERIRSDPEAIYLGTSYSLRVHRDLYRRDPRRYAKAHAITGVSALRIRRYREARRHLLQAVLADPLRLEHWTRLALSLAPPLAHRRWELATRTSSDG